MTIKPEGIEKVYDLKVEGVHNFIANDFFVHNSGAIEQDADVVMFLWRPEEEDMGTMELDVAKHRNGPLRNISLHWQGNRIKFFGIEKKRGGKE